MKKLIFICFTIFVLIGCCKTIIYITIENDIQRQFYIDCLRLNKIDFALKDDGEILILGNESYKKLNELRMAMYSASVDRNLDICSPK